MADNTIINTGTGGDTIASDDLTTLNGGAVSGVKIQRVKPSFGSDATARDVDATNPLPIQVGDAGSQSSVFPAGFLRVTDEPRQIFYENFDTALDSTNVWTAPTVGNSAVVASVSGGTMTMGTGTTASGWSKLISIPTFKLTVPAWIGYSFTIALSDGAAPVSNAYRSWGLLSIPAVPTTAAPLTDAYVFELTTAGKLQAVIWAAGVRTLIADLSSTGTNKQPLDINMHIYIVYVRTDRVYWYIDGISAAQSVATSNFQESSIQTLATGFVAIGGATPPASNVQIQCSGLAVWDTGKNATQIADGTFPWRKATISAAGALSVSIAAAQTIAVTQATSANLNATVAQQTLTKGTQGATGVTTQDFKDAGRNAIHFYTLIPVLTSATDALQSLTGTKGGVTVTATTTPGVVTTGKTFRVTRMAATYIATATSGYGIVRLRFNTAGVVAITSPIAATLVIGSGAPTTVNSSASEEATLDEGWEFAAATGIGISVQGFAAVTATAVGYVLVSITGYEY